MTKSSEPTDAQHQTNTMAKPLTGSLKKNDKQGIETRPDYRGKITLLDGQEFWVSGLGFGAKTSKQNNADLRLWSGF